MPGVCLQDKDLTFKYFKRRSDMEGGWRESQGAKGCPELDSGIRTETQLHVGTTGSAQKGKGRSGKRLAGGAHILHLVNLLRWPVRFLAAGTRTSLYLTVTRRTKYPSNLIQWAGFVCVY